MGNIRANPARVADPGLTLVSAADVALGMGVVQPLPVPPFGTRRMVVQVTSGLAGTTEIRIREVGGLAGSGIILVLYGSRVFGGGEGSLTPLEAENMAGPASSVAVQFELD